MIGSGNIFDGPLGFFDFPVSLC